MSDRPRNFIAVPKTAVWFLTGVLLGGLTATSICLLTSHHGHGWLFGVFFSPIVVVILLCAAWR